jgi:hypothetical protein
LIWDVRRFTQRPGKSVVLTAAELESCWEDLGGSAARSYRAIGQMTASPERTVAVLRQRLKPAPLADTKRIAGLIAGLGSEQFQTREQAMKDLEKLGEVVAPALQKALAGDGKLEVKRRLEGLLEKLEGASLPPETLRAVRAVEVLEGIGTPAARAVLERLVAEGAPEARLTREAEAALRRLK